MFQTGEDMLLAGEHLALLGKLGVVPSGEVEQAVHDAAQQFLIESLAVILAVSQSGVRAHEDLAVVKGDHIGGRGIIEELAVHGGDALV